MGLTSRAMGRRATRWALLAVLALGTLSAAGGQENEPRLAGLVVRATEGGRPVDDLGFVDFELSIGSRPQALQAVAFVRQNTLERREGPTFLDLPDARHLNLVFCLTHFTPEVEAVIKDFALNGLRPGDVVRVVTYSGSYTMSPYALEAKSREALAQELTAIVRGDVQACTDIYDDILTNLRQMSSGLGGLKSGSSLEMRYRSGSAQFSEIVNRQIPRYRESLEKLERLRRFDSLMLRLDSGASKSRAWPGMNSTLLFHESPLRPELAEDVLTSLYRLFRDNPKLEEDISFITNLYQTDTTPDAKSIRDFFGRAENQLFLIDVPVKAEEAGDASLTPVGEAFHSLFSQVAAATGGAVESGSDPAASLRDVLEQVGTYYVLFYSPLSAPQDDSFRTVRVGLKFRQAELRYREGDYGVK
jgi:hypothetical protein